MLLKPVQGSADRLLRRPHLPTWLAHYSLHLCTFTLLGVRYEVQKTVVKFSALLQVIKEMLVAFGRLTCTDVKKNTFFLKYIIIHNNTTQKKIDWQLFSFKLCKFLLTLLKTQQPFSTFACLVRALVGQPGHDHQRVLGLQLGEVVDLALPGEHGPPREGHVLGSHSPRAIQRSSHISVSSLQLKKHMGLPQHSTPVLDGQMRLAFLNCAPSTGSMAGQTAGSQAPKHTSTHCMVLLDAKASLYSTPVS